MKLPFAISLLLLSTVNFAQKTTCSALECTGTNALNISTGYDPVSNAMIKVGGIDPLWKLINYPPLKDCILLPTIKIPNANVVDGKGPTWLNVNSNPSGSVKGILSANTLNELDCDNLFENQPWKFRRYFCACAPTDVVLSGNIRIDDKGKLSVYDLNNTQLATVNVISGTNINTPFNFNLQLNTGGYYLEVEVLNTGQGLCGFNIKGLVTTTREEKLLVNSNASCCSNNGSITIQKILEKTETCNGRTDAGETAGSGWTFLLKDAKNQAIKTQKTDANGQITFNGLPKGTYTIEEVAQTGWEAYSPQSGIQQVVMGANDVKTITFYNCPGSLKFDPCCPPMNKSVLEKLFIPRPVGAGLNQPYLLDFNNDPLFCTQSQAYLDYLKSLYPGVGNMIFNWRIFDSGTGNLPGNGPQVGADVYTSFKPGGLGTHTLTKFFTTQLAVGRWYKIHVGMYTEPGINRIPAECSNETTIYYRIQTQTVGSIAKIAISDGKQIIKESELKSAKN